MKHTSSHSFRKNLWSLIKPYWVSNEKWGAYLLLATIIALNLGTVYVAVRINYWRNDFYNALQAYDKISFFHNLFVFSYLAANFIIIAVYRQYLYQMLYIRWRRWLTISLVDHWLHKQNYYHLQLNGQSTDNPDQRISEDVGQLIDGSLGLSLGVLDALVTFGSFITVLWILSGQLAVSFSGYNFYIPGFMVWGALIYSIIGTWLTHKVGSPLIALNFNQQRREADFRFSLVRFRENSENVAFYNGETQEKGQFLQRFSALFHNYWQIMKRTKKLTWLTSFYAQAAVIFPFLLAEQRYFSKQIALGGLMQTIEAFGRVQESLSFIVSSYGTIAGWKATANRLITFQNHMVESESYVGFQPQHADADKLQVRNLDVSLPSGQALLNKVNLEVARGDSVLITGPSGCGKTTLLRTLAGIWPYAQGTVEFPANAKILFLPQKAYLPLGTLKEILYYHTKQGSDEEAFEILQLCKLTHLYDRIHAHQNWSQLLSVGEQQRISFARAIISQPDFLFLDEATSALDEEAEQEFYGLLKSKCLNTSVVSVGHRSSLKPWHDREWSCADYRVN
jgi:putative ATP-binding cassette transporter